jgi:HemY protein
MLRAVKFMLLATALLALAWWVGGLPGTVTAHAGPYAVTTSTPAAILLLFIVAVLLTMLLRVLGGIRHAPGAFGGWRAGKRAAAGEAATLRGLAALAAEDAQAAKAEAAKALKLLGETPLALMLSAEAARLAGDAAQAKTAFEKLTQHRELKFLGHRGLLRQSLAAQDHEAARQHAQAAEAAYPGSAWTRAQRLELALHGQNYATALGLTRDKHEIAALATAASRNAADPAQALRFAKQAVKADPQLAPAVAALATSLRALGKARAAKKALYAGWQAAPHPLIATAWFTPGTTPLERAKEAPGLAAANPGHVESELLLARTDFDAGLTGEAKRHAQAALDAGGTDGRAQGVLDQLSGKPAQPSRFAWICDSCHHAQEEWAPVCPVCHKIGMLNWHAPGTALV